MSKYAFPFEYDGRINPGLSERDFIAAEVLKGLTANPNLVDTTNIVRSSDGADLEVKRDEHQHQQRMAQFARMLADHMVDEMNAVPSNA